MSPICVNNSHCIRVGAHRSSYHLSEIFEVNGKRNYTYKVWITGV